LLTFVLTMVLAASPQVEAVAALRATPRFAEYRVVAYGGTLSDPQIVTSEQRRFRTLLRKAISKGYGVVEGGTEHERIGPNFAGHYILVQWGCGLPCMETAVIDAKDGRVLRLPRIPGDTDSRGFVVPTSSDDLRELQFKRESRLLGIPYVEDGMTYWYSLARDWKLIGKTRTRVN